MMMKKAVLATDFSDSSRCLMDCVEEFKTVGLKELILIHVIDAQNSGLSSPALQQYDQDYLDREKERLSRRGIEVKVRVELGYPAQKIVEVAREEKASIILVGSHGKGFLRELLLGSTAFDIIRSSDIPVFIEKIRREEGKEPRPICVNRLENVLIPVDFSPCSELVVERTLHLAPYIERVSLISIIETSRDEEEMEKTKREYENDLKEIARRFSEQGVDVDTRVSVGLASEMILKRAEEFQATLIALGTRGAGRLQRLLLGSTADAVARRSKYPILLFPCR